LVVVIVKRTVFCSQALTDAPVSGLNPEPMSSILEKTAGLKNSDSRVLI